MLQEILLNEPGEKKNNENLNEILNFFDKPCLNSPLNKRDFLLPLDENIINAEMGSKISLKEMENRNSSDDKPINDLGDAQKFMDDEDNENPDHPKSQPGSQLIMTNSVSLDNSDGK